MAIDTNYQLRIGEETIPQYHERVAQYNASKSPPTATPPINRTVYDPSQTSTAGTSGTSAADNFLDTFRAPESAARIAERKRQQSQGLIDSINKQFDDVVAQRREIGAERVQRDNTLSVMTGNMGGSEAIQSRNKVDSANQKEIDAVNNQRALALSEVYTNISSAADAEAREQLLDAQRSAEQVIARRKEAQTSAVENLKLMASSGAVDFDVFKSTPGNKKVYDYALEAMGGSEDALRGLFALNRPQDQVLDKRVVGSTMYITYQNPQTGKVRSDHFDLGFQVPVEWKNVDLGDRVMFFDPNNPDNRKYYAKGMTPDQAADNARQDGEEDPSGSPSDGPGGALDQLKFLKDTAATAKSLSSASGPSDIVKNLGDKYIGDSKFRRLEAQTNTLRTNVLTLVTDPEVKKFFGPQMSEADVRLMTAAGTTLNPESQSPKELKAEIERLEDLFNRMQTALETGAASSGGGDIKSQVTAAGFNYDQMRADGYTDDQIKASLGL